MVKPPCKECHYRRVGCQSDCLGYKNYRTELEREKALIRKDKESRYAITSARAGYLSHRNRLSNRRSYGMNTYSE